MSKCKKYGNELPTHCYVLCGYEDCPRHNLYKPTRFDTFREQTATIDGLVEWILRNGNCDTTCAFYDLCIVHNPDDFVYDCKAGIKAYWEGEAT